MTQLINSIMGLNEFVTGKELVNKAKQFATSKHEGQFRKFGNKPYIIHPDAVADLVNLFGGTPEMIAAAWLHDVVEESQVTFQELNDEFGHKVAVLVFELTSPPDLDKSKKGEYLAQKMNTMSSDALTIKLADRLNNVSGLDSAKPGFVRKYVPETKFIMDALENGERPLNSHQIQLIEAIKKAIQPYEVN